jgi:hypothetical protein
MIKETSKAVNNRDGISRPHGSESVKVDFLKIFALTIFVHFWYEILRCMEKYYISVCTRCIISAAFTTTDQLYHFRRCDSCEMNTNTGSSLKVIHVRKGLFIQLKRYFANTTDSGRVKIRKDSNPVRLNRYFKNIYWFAIDLINMRIIFLCYYSLGT